MLAYTLIHNCDPTKYQAGEIVEILPPDPNPSPEWRMAVNKLEERESGYFSLLRRANAATIAIIPTKMANGANTGACQ